MIIHIHHNSAIKMVIGMMNTIKKVFMLVIVILTDLTLLQNIVLDMVLAIQLFQLNLHRLKLIMKTSLLKPQSRIPVQNIQEEKLFKCMLAHQKVKFQNQFKFLLDLKRVKHLDLEKAKKSLLYVQFDIVPHIVKRIHNGYLKKELTLFELAIVVEQHQLLQK